MVAEGAFDLSTAQAPAICGAAIDVPEKFEKLSPGNELLIHLPGASKCRNEALLEKLDTASAVVPKLPSSVEPALIAVEIQAGKPRPPSDPLFPAAIIVGMSIERRVSMAAFNDGLMLSQCVVKLPPPMLMLAAAMLKLPLSSW